MTKTNTQMLADLNVLRVAKNLKPLKAWKESTVKLAECLAKMGGKIEAPVYLNLTRAEPEVSKETTPKAADMPKLLKDVAKVATNIAKVAKEKAAKPVKAAPASNNRKGVRTLADGEVHLTSIANSMKLAPKTARAIARQHKVAIAKLQVSGKKYVFTKANVAQVRAILEAPAKGK